MKLQSMIVVFLMATTVTGCSGIKSIQKIESSEPYFGPQTIALAPSEYAPGRLLFVMVVQTAFGGLGGDICAAAGGRLPEGTLMKDIKQRASELGADYLLFDCGSPGTKGACLCNVKGYKR